MNDNVLINNINKLEPRPQFEPRPPLKKQFFWSNPYKIEVMRTSHIKMLELPKFGHMTTSII